jgi:NAD(P)-dependent dehydrogenase (short-subunit alcohol dehydrogenase family)
MKKELTGQVAVVTGGGRGFGKAIALGFATAGAAVTVTARSADQLSVTVNEIKAAGGQALAVPGDVTSRPDVACVIETTMQHFGPVTLLVNNAGVAGPYGPIGVVDPDEWWNSHAVHVRGSLLYMSAVLPAMEKHGGGRIINVASRGGTEVTPSLSAYCVGKATQMRLTEHVAAEGRTHGISAFAIEPGTVFTELAEGTITSPDAQRWLPEMIEILKDIKNNEDPERGLARCTEMCVKLASGRYDALSGRYLTPDDDFDALLDASG